MTVSTILAGKGREVITIEPTASLNDAVRLLTDNRIGAAVILGAAAPVPHRANAAAAVLSGKRVDETVAAQAARAALDGATPLAKNAYKLPLFEALVRRAILRAA